MNLNQNIAYYRKCCGLTQEQLAEQLGVTGQSISKWENCISNPDISIIPALARALGVDVNALFSEIRQEPEPMPFDALPDLAYDAIITLFYQANRSFYGISGIETADSLQKHAAYFKKQLTDNFPKYALMIDEGNDRHGSVLVSDAFSFIDRSYGGKDSALLFDLDKAGEVLSVLGKRLNRKILKYIYEKQITGGESATFVSMDAIAAHLGENIDDVQEAVVELRHISLIDQIETIENSICKKEIAVLYAKDFIFPIAIMRLAHILASNMSYTTLLYRDALGGRNYEGEGL